MGKSSEQILLSVIIPVYNVRRYLRECIDSIAGEGDFDGRYEVLLIDDGSCDGSGQICDEFAQRYYFIQVVHQKNVGLGAARNAGIQRAAGEFLLFVDADDFISPGSLCVILQEIQKRQAELTFLNIYHYYQTGLRYDVTDKTLKRINGLNKNMSMQIFAGLKRYPGSACGKLVRRDWLVKNQIYFEENVLSEDIVWTLKCLVYAKTYRYMELDYYNYRQGRMGSITSSCDAKRLRDLLHVIRQGIIVAKSLAGRKYQREIYAMLAYEAEVALLFLGMLPKKERKDFKEKTKELLWLLKYREVTRTKWIRYLVRYMGVERAAVLLKYLYFLKKRCYGDR